MKILQILPALNQGGVEYYVLENCQHISQYADSYVISAGGRLVETLIQSGSEHFTLPIEKKGLHALLQIKKLTKLIESIHPDIIHIHSRLQAWLIYFCLKKLSYRPKIVTTVHGFNSVNRYSKQMLNADAVIVVSEALKNYLIESYPDRATQKFNVIPQGIDPDKFYPDAHISDSIKDRLTSLGINLEQDQILLLPGRITRIKGISLLIDLMAHLKSDGYHAVKAVIVGGFDERNAEFYQAMKSRILEEQLEDQILWFGTCDDMTSIYRLADITLSITSKPESYGRTVIESLACGTPVVGFDYGGVGENLRLFYPEGRIEPHDQFALYANVLQQLSIPKSQKEIVRISDTIDQSQAKLQALYRSLL